MAITRQVNITNLVRELSENRTIALETLREAMANAWDHGASKFWLRTSRNARGELTVYFADNGSGMSLAGLAAFWGVGASDKAGVLQPVGYKGHGSKLLFSCQRLTVITRSSNTDPFLVTSLTDPSRFEGLEIPSSHLRDHPQLEALLKSFPFYGDTGTLIIVEDLRASGREELLDRRKIESYCDWFTVIGDVRSGLFDTRKEFHEAIDTGDTHALKGHERPLRPLGVYLQINGEDQYTLLGSSNPKFYGSWKDDQDHFRTRRPEIVHFGHRFADVHKSQGAVTRVRDDLSAIRLTGSHDASAESSHGLTMIVRVEGNRRQRETYLEASWQGHTGLYSFEGRFGLWLCRDFVPIVRRPDLLQRALSEAAPPRMSLEFANLRNWQVFINSQAFLPTANRNDISNFRDHEDGVLRELIRVLKEGFKNPDFVSWVSKLQGVKLEGDRNNEREQMERRKQEIIAWLNDSKRRDAIEPTEVSTLSRLPADESLLMRAPRNEQELFHLYGLLSSRYKLPVRVLEYNASRGVDAVALLLDRALIPDLQGSHVRVEFKYEVAANNPIDHFFTSIDVIVCWAIDKTGPVYERSAAGTAGQLQAREHPVLPGGLDSHEIVYQAVSSGARSTAIPVVVLSRLFQRPTRGARKGARS